MADSSSGRESNSCGYRFRHAPAPCFINTRQIHFFTLFFTAKPCPLTVKTVTVTGKDFQTLNSLINR